MYIVEVKGEDMEGRDEGKAFLREFSRGKESNSIIVSDVKKILVGAGARALFYPTLLYNVLRNKLEAEFRWWDKIDEEALLVLPKFQFILLGAVPFRTDVPRLKELGIGAVVTLNEPYERLVPSSLYHAYGIDHLVIPTQDYCFAPSLTDINTAVDIIHENSSCERITYVHCKAGCGRSTTIAVSYLIKYKQMTPDVAYSYVRFIRPRVLLASSQWQAVQEFHYYINKTVINHGIPDEVAFDKSSTVLVTESDLEGYGHGYKAYSVGSNKTWNDPRLVYRVKVAGQAALSRITCLWLSCRNHRLLKSSEQHLNNDSSYSNKAARLEVVRMDIHAY